MAGTAYTRDEETNRYDVPTGPALPGAGTLASLGDYPTLNQNDFDLLDAMGPIGEPIDMGDQDGQEDTTLMTGENDEANRNAERLRREMDERLEQLRDQEKTPQEDGFDY